MLNSLTKYKSRQRVLIYCCGIVITVTIFYLQTFSVDLQFSSQEIELRKTIRKKKLWYFLNGSEFPNVSKTTINLLSDSNMLGNRIMEQLMYIPQNYNTSTSPEKLILLYYPIDKNGWALEQINVFDGCPVNRCSITSDRTKFYNADAVLFREISEKRKAATPTNQIWIFLTQESPKHIRTLKYPHGFNWTITYRRDSDIVAPYFKWIYYDPKVTQMKQIRNYAQNKTKKVAWFVSNCKNVHNNRVKFANDLAKYIPVDIYGKCGALKCPRNFSSTCFEYLEKDYKFYLSFENSNCRDYITEKLCQNALSHNVLPIVMGAHPDDYEISAPKNSYIHVEEFNNTKALADYLHLLDQDDDLYNSYFKWKGTGELTNSHYWCRVCAMLHNPITEHSYPDINKWWWYKKGDCKNNLWMNF